MKNKRRQMFKESVRYYEMFVPVMPSWLELDGCP